MFLLLINFFQSSPMQPKLKENISVDDEEVAKFSAIADEWWDEKGKFAPLHKINPLRLAYLRQHAVGHFGLNDELIAPLDGLTVLDIGCGGGLICEPMARMGATVTGIDASEKNIAVASLHAQKSGISVAYHATSAEALAEHKVQHDVVLALEIIEHVADVDVFLDACTTLLKPGGMMVITTLNRTIKSYAFAIVGAEYILRWLPTGTHDWKKFIKPSELAAHMRKRGLTMNDLTGMVYNPLKVQWDLSKSDVDVNYLMAVEKPL